MERCYNCGKLRKVSVAGSYRYLGEKYDILLCQWCKAVSTRRKNAKLPKPHINRKKGGDK